jgi:hypothetical protein
LERGLPLRAHQKPLVFDWNGGSCPPPKVGEGEKQSKIFDGKLTLELICMRKTIINQKKDIIIKN